MIVEGTASIHCKETSAGRGQKVRTDLKWYVHKGVKKNSANVHEKTLKDMSLYMQLACNFSLQFFSSFLIG